MSGNLEIRDSHRLDNVDKVVSCRFPAFGTGGDEVRRQMSSKMKLDHLQELQKSSGRTPESILTMLGATWALVLRCYTGSDRIFFGFQETDLDSAADDSRKKDETLHNMAVTSITIEDSTSLREVVERAAEKFFHPSDCQDAVPPTLLPSFNTAIVLQKYPDSVETEDSPVITGLPKECRLRLLVKRVNSNINVFLEWWHPNISETLAMSIIDIYNHVLSAIILTPDITVKDFDFLGERDRQQIFEWNTRLPEEVDRCVHEMIQDQVSIRPNAEAVCAWDGTLTYSELDRLASSLAVHLVQRGIGPEQWVPLCFDKSKWNIVAMLGVLKAGGAFVPLDPSHPKPRLQALVQSINATTLLCSPQHASHLSTVAASILPLDGSMMERLATNLNGTCLETRARSNNAAYLIFTSGSTGKPKGTMVEHRAYCSSAKAHAPWLLINSSSRVLQFAAHTFDASLAEILTPLMHGGCVCIPNEEVRLNDIVTAINDMCVNHAILTPSFIGFIEPSAVPGLKSIVLAGEAMSKAHIATWSHLNLVNGYGPAESSVTAAVNPKVTLGSDPKDIGFPVGVRCWIVDPDNHDRLLPIGCIGELLLEGPPLARGYINNPQRTADSFIFDPEWAKDDTQSTDSRRFYKTGDLVRYNSDAGSLNYVGRKDTQVKLHGQRIELGEIEYYFSLDKDMRHSLVLLPKTGYFKEKLVIVLSLSEKLFENTTAPRTSLKLIEQSKIGAHIEQIRDRISSRLPTYMVPSIWLCVEELPFLSSRKLDRKKVSEWVENMEEDRYHQAQSQLDQVSTDDGQPTTDTESQLRSIWSRVLNIPLSRIGTADQSFLSLGGDSITAMTCMNACKRNGMSLTVREVLRSRSIRELASCVKRIHQRADNHHESPDQSFGLSPIQDLHFQVRGGKQGHFNQSFFLRLKVRVDENDLLRAVQVLISRHSMLRARFACTGTDSRWQQRVTREIKGSYRFLSHRVSSQDDTKDAIASSQSCLNAQDGPLLAIDLFNLDGRDQLLSMVGHHLVIDLVSWRVILEDLEELLLNPSRFKLPDGSLPFQNWCHLQADHSRNVHWEKQLSADSISLGDFSYWGMEGCPNIYGDVVCEGFEVDSTTTMSLLTNCNEALRTEPVDILLTALLYSFKSIFSDRPLPSIYNEGHGREAWDPSIDISRTVGWFTVIYPISVPTEASTNIIDTLIRVKDIRRQVSDNGRAYFASQILHNRDSNSYRYMELIFNYLGKYQQLERDDALFQPMESLAGETSQGGAAADFGKETQRFGLFEISAVATQQILRFSFSFNAAMKHQARIREWISACHMTLMQLSESLLFVKRQLTLSDFPLLSLTYDDLRIITTKVFPHMGIKSVGEIEDAYPCSPIQQGIMLSRSREDLVYTVHTTYEVKGRGGKAVDAELLAFAWQKVVDRHAMLRTVFVENLTAKELYCQIVLKSYSSPPSFLRCWNDSDVLKTMDGQQKLRFGNYQPTYRFTICLTPSGKVFCRLEMSHALMDATSIAIIFSDLELAYAGLLNENGRPLFSGFISHLQNQSREVGIEFWRSYLLKMEPCHFPLLTEGLPDKKRYQSLRLEFKDLARLQALCDETGLTVPNAFHGAWSLTLRCYTGSDDICFGYLLSERDVPVDKIDEVVGPMINMLPCRVTLPGTARVGHILQQIQEDYIRCLTYKHTSLAEVQHALGLSETPLFNTCISHSKTTRCAKNREPAITFLEHSPIHDPTEYPISINIEATADDVIIDMDYWTDHISDGQAMYIANTFLRCLENIINHPTEEIGNLDNIGSHNLRQISSWNAKTPVFVDRCLHDLFEEQVKAQPESPAICAWDGNFSYAQLNDISLGLAHHLVQFGVAPETMVAICFDKSALTIVSMLAVLKAGGVCVPLDATHPKEIIDARVLNADAKIALVSSERAHLFEGVVPSIVTVNASFLNELPKRDGPACTAVHPFNAAFVIFTSGSTGKPKGVVLEHRSLSSSAEAHGSALGIGPSTRFLQFAAYTFDNSLEEIFTTLVRGGCVCVPSDHDRFNNLAKAINELEVNCMDLTPTVLSFIRPSDVPRVRTVAVGGEVLTKELRNIWCNSTSFQPLYGPTECSINCMHNPQIAESAEASNIGWSVGCVSWVVDPLNHGHLVPIGSIGELLIEGPILARGYLNDDEKTKQSFIEDPSWVSALQGYEACSNSVGTTRSRRRMYKTGDLVRYNPNGSLVYLGRKDTQVKLNGQRVELGEIEYHVKQALPPEYQSAVEVAEIRSEQKNIKAVIAFIAFKTDSFMPPSENFAIMPMSGAFQSTTNALHESLLISLPVYMIPSVYIPVSTLPLTSSGKLNRKILRTNVENIHLPTYRIGSKHGRAPSSVTEKLLQQLWASVLGVDANTIYAEDTFFKHGGDSIGAMRLATAARTSSYILTVAKIFQAPKLSEMAKEMVRSFDGSSDELASPEEPFSLVGEDISTMEIMEEVASLCQISVDAIEDIYPCTAIQEGLIALSMRRAGAYVTQNIYKLPSDVDIQRFQNAWQGVAGSEVVLRTRVVHTKNHGFLQVVVRESISWQYLDDVEEITESERNLPSYNGGNLIRYAIAGKDTDSLCFVWIVHHALYDGWCIPTLLNKVESWYHGPDEQERASGCRYSQFIRYLSSLDTAQSDAFWRERLAGSSLRQFPSLPQPSYKVAVTSQLCHSVQIPRLSQVDVTLPSIIRAAWALTVSVYSCSDDVVFGEILTGRDAPLSGIVDMIGPTMATVPMRIRINRQDSVTKFIQNVQKWATEAIPHQFSGLQHIRKLSQDAQMACDFRIVMAITHDNEPTGSFWNLLSAKSGESTFFTYPLNLTFTISRMSVNIDVHYDQGVLATSYVERLLSQFDTLLTRLCSKSCSLDKLSQLELAKSEDLITIQQWNRESLKFVDRCIHDMVEDNVRLRPQAMAICSADVTFTYSELDQLSTSLAHRLEEIGIQSNPSLFVPICFEKSALTIVVMLAILKAGCAFAPLDPQHPQSRLQEIVTDLNAVLVLCSPRYWPICSNITKNALAIDLQMLRRLPIKLGRLPACPTSAMAYAIFTSGTTGKPKGIIIHHAAFCSGASKFAPALMISPESRVLQFASYTFDACLIETLATLIIGGCVCVPDESSRLNALAGVINDMNIDTALLTPSVAQMINPLQVPSLRTLILAGEAMSSSHLSTWAGKVDLVNAYGPSECSVVAAAKSHMSVDTAPTNIGNSIDTCWIVDPNNHDVLLPIGAIGELLIEGPTLARGYLNNDAKTSESFVRNPKWAINGTSTITKERKMYKTGDLVRYAPNDSGEIIYVGRKDNQAKLHGQRLELEEVEYYLNANPAVQHALAIIPKAGYCAERLVAVLSLQNFADVLSTSRELEIMSSSDASMLLSGIKGSLKASLPPYMIPANWILLLSLPLLASGKLDRRRIEFFVESVDENTYRRITSADCSDEINNLEATYIERRIQVIWGQALSLPAESIPLNCSFLHLGGDSISAMTVMSRCRAENLAVTVQDIMTCKSIPDLASTVTLPEENDYQEDDKEFDLSPIQHLYFQCMEGRQTQFNQSMLLQFKQRVPVEDLKNAIHELVRAHSMLRARFSQDKGGLWKQHISKDIYGSFKLQVLKVREGERLRDLMDRTQKSINVVDGPVIAVDILDTGLELNQLFIAAHHLVVDVVSWNIILQDLEDLLRFKVAQAPNTIPFQNWCRLQKENAQKISPKDALPVEEIAAANTAYWGMTDVPNNYGAVVTEEVQLEAGICQDLLNARHRSSQVEVVDVILAALLASFGHVFHDRANLPVIYNEGHGREPWNAALDVSRTIGWFTTLTPVHLPGDYDANEGGSLLNCIRWVKELRGRTPDRGRQYFAYRWLTADGREKFRHHWPMEIMFNYLGQIQKLTQTDGILQPINGTGQCENTYSDIGPDIPRFALIEVSAAVIQENLNISFSYHKSMRNQPNIREWIAECRNLMHEASRELMQQEAGQMLRHFPLLPLSYHGIEKLREKLVHSGASLINVEDAYPCSPMQQGILLSHLKDSETYAYRSTFEVRLMQSDNTISVSRLVEAWQAVVQRHPALRTIFVDSIHGSSFMDQVVFKSVEAEILVHEHDIVDVRKVSANLGPLNLDNNRPPHRFSIFKTRSGRVFCRLDINSAISDGSSIPILLHDLSRAYIKRIEPNSSGFRYSDFISYTRSIPQGTAAQYWKRYLAGIEPCIFPSLLGPTKAAKKAPKQAGSHVLIVSQTPELQSFCRCYNVTPSNVFQLVWGLVLRCYTGSDEICFGYLTSGRDTPIDGIEDAVGVFINMLICRLDLTDDLNLQDALLQTQMDFMKAMEYQTISLAEVQHELGLSEVSLFNTAFTFQKRSNIGDDMTPSLTFDLIDSLDPSEYKIGVNVEASKASIEVHFTYWEESLSGEHIKDISDTFQHILHDILHQNKASRTIGSIESFGELSCQKVRSWNSQPPDKIERCIHEAIDEQTSLQPSSAAVCSWDANFTYMGLQVLSQKLAAKLKEFGVGPEVNVPICFEKSAWAVVAQLAVLRAGGAFVSLDPSQPQSRLRNLIDEVGAQLVLCSSQSHAKMLTISKTTFVINAQTVDQLEDHPATESLFKVKPSNAAYIIFTSGSTGKPKGTVIEHSAFCTSAASHSKALCMDPNSRVFQFASFTFDASIMEILTTLTVGGCICIPSDDERLNDIPAAMERMGANWVCLTPSIANTIKPESIPSLKFLVTGGEVMPPGYIDRWAKTTSVINAYGPTECSVVASASTKVDLNGNYIDRNPANIGKATCSRSWIVDPRNHNHLVPIGVSGELVLESFALARGYLNNEVKTNDVFIQDPAWVHHDGLQDILKERTRMYRTGDLVRYNLDGSLSYIARTDTQIKLNGQRIELGEIEYQCKQNLPDQTQVAVDLVFSGTNSKKLAVFLTIPDTRPENENAGNKETRDNLLTGLDTNQLLLPVSEHVQDIANNLKNSLSSVLPAYMIPQIFFPVSNLPWSSAGKLDRKRLHSEVRALTIDDLRVYAMSGKFVRKSPRNEMEQTLCELWEQILNIPAGSAGVEDSFFKLGGDSLAAMRLAGAARQRGIVLTVVNIFRCPVLAEMAESCEFSTEGRESAALKKFGLLSSAQPIELIISEVVSQCGITEHMISDIYPCSFLQEGLITLSVKQSGAYVAQNVFQLSDDVDIEIFKSAWRRAVDELDILRTRIVHTASSNFVQVVLKEQSIDWQSAGNIKEVLNNATQLPRHNGDLLTRYTIVQPRNSTSRYFIWSIHHALYDGWSLSLILKRVQEIYFGLSQGIPQVSYVIFIDYLHRRDISASDRFWKSYLSDLTSSHFPLTSGPSSNYSPDTTTISTKTEISDSFSRLDLTAPTVVRAAWAIILSAYTTSQDVCFGETLTGRDIDMAGITDIVGPILTTVPMRIQVNRKIKLVDYLLEVRRLSTEIIPHQHSGLQHIKKLNLDASVACDFQNLLVIQAIGGEMDENLWAVHSSTPEKNFFTYPLVIECKASNSRVETNLYYDKKIISYWQAQKLLDQFVFVLKQLCEVTTHDSRRLGEIDVFSPEDKRELEMWNRRKPPSIDKCISEIFQNMCLSQAEAPAVCAWDGNLTYNQLNDYSLRLATYLSSFGVGPDVFVPLCFDKSLWAIVAMLGIMTAGGAMVPLDPAHPVSRHQEICKELDAKIILVSQNYAERYSQIAVATIPVNETTVKDLPINSRLEEGMTQALSSNAAYAIFTSGSTGRAKGVVIEHGAFISSSLAFRSTMLMKPTSRVLQFASLSFDASVLEIFTTLTCGGCVCIPSEDERIRDISGAICRMSVSWALLTPSVANLIDPSTVPGLKVLVCGGEKLSPEVISKWGKRVHLINAYGPSEAAVVATVNANVLDKTPSCIGYGISSTLTWVVDPNNHDKLCPLGAIGELALEGPTLARCYLNDPQKTAAAFVENPKWAIDSGIMSVPRNIYKTGDLVKYNSDGSLDYIGRKDNQVKLHGQRLDLGEIEHRLNMEPLIRHVIVFLAKSGIFQQRLVAVLSLTDLIAPENVLSTSTCNLLEEEQLRQKRPEIIKIRTRLEGQLPSYMLPQAWAVVESVPILVSGKLDRNKVKAWLESIDNDTYERIMGSDTSEEQISQATKTAAILQDIWANVLNMPSEKVKLNKPFISLGGDSITAMAVVARCHKRKIKVSLHDVLRSQSILRLARTVEASALAVEEVEESGDPFELSPIQRLYFQSTNGYQGRSRFNQSISVRFLREVDGKALESAIKAIIHQHPMLRARFGLDAGGNWQQRFTKDIDASYRYRIHESDGTNSISSLVAESQACLDIQHGPLLAADLFDVHGDGQVLFLAAHHLCVDIVSWGIILQDLQDMLESGSIIGDRPLSFQTWCKFQKTQINQENSRNEPPLDVTPAYLRYWSMEGVPNTYGDVVYEKFTVDEEITVSAMEACHAAFRTQPLDVLISAIVHSFRRVFTDRHLPALFNETHGRDLWGADIDPSRTVGWFTTLCPLQTALESNDVLETLRCVKDVRRKIADKGRLYLANKFLTSDGQYDTSSLPIEILFNFLGGMQKQQRDNTMFEYTELATDDSDPMLTGDVGPDATRLALFEITAAIVQGKLQFSFMYNRNIPQTSEIQRWITECKWALEETVIRSRCCPPKLTLSDYPLLPITNKGLERLLTEGFPKAGINHRDDVEDIYPCSPTQEGMLLTQLRDPNAYFTHVVFEVKHSDKSHIIDVQRLGQAWKKVVERHAALRTIFIDSPCKGGAFDQLVMKTIESEVTHIRRDDSEAMKELDSIKLCELNSKRTRQLPHQISICSTPSGRLLLKIEINHAIIDGGSSLIIMRDLEAAYEDKLSEGTRPLYSDYIRYIRTYSKDIGIKFWKKYLQGIRPCHLSHHLSDNSGKGHQLASLRMSFDGWAELQMVCEQRGVTLANVVQGAWALVLRCFTGLNDVCFGYLSAGRDAPVNGIQDTLGVFINMLCCRVRFMPSEIFDEVPHRVQDHFLRSIQYQPCSLAQIQHELGLPGKALFNTALSIQNHFRSDDSEESSLIFESQAAHDPSEYTVTLNIETTRNDEGILFRYWTDLISSEQVTALSITLAKILEVFAEQQRQTVQQLCILLSQNLQESGVKVAIVSEHEGDNDRQLLDYSISSSLSTSDNADADSNHDPLSDSDAYSRYSDDSFKDETIQRSIDTQSKYRQGFSIVECHMLRVWGLILGIEQGSINKADNFFELGGDSITAMELVGAIRDSGLNLTVADVFRNPIFENMAAVIQAVNGTKDFTQGTGVQNFNTPDSVTHAVSHERFTLLKAVNVDDAFLLNRICPKVGVFKGGIADILPVTDFQALAITGAILGSRSMLNYVFLDGRGELDIRRLKQSCFHVARTFDILRTVFVCSRDRFLQVILRKIRPEFYVYETDSSLEEFTSTLLQRDRELGPQQGEHIVQFILVKAKSDGAHRILIRLSHAQYDGVCLPKILSAVKAGYEGDAISLGSSFASFVRDSAKTITSEHYQHWKTLLKGSSMTQLVHEEGPKSSKSPGTTTVVLKKCIRLPTMALGSITTATIIKSAWALALANVTSKRDVVFGHTISGRNASFVGIENVIGPCLNVIPIRVLFKDNWSALDLLRYVQDQQVANMPFETLGFRQIIKNCTDWPDWATFATIVQHQNAGLEDKMLIGDNLYKVGCVGNEDNFGDISFFSMPQKIDKDKIDISLSFSLNGPISESLAEQLLNVACDMAESFVSNPNMLLSLPPIPSASPIQIAMDIDGLVSEPLVLSQPERLNTAELTGLSDILTRTWQGVLGGQGGNFPVVKPDSSFFDLGGDVVNLAQVAWLLEQEGLKVHLDDLIDSPKLSEQIVVLASYKSKHEAWETGVDTSIVSTGTTESSPKPRKSKFLTSVINIARKLLRSSVTKS